MVNSISFYAVLDACGYKYFNFMYYGGRGANLGDISPLNLERAYQFIKENINPKATTGFLEMIVDIEYLSVNNFARSLEMMERQGWEYIKGNFSRRDTPDPDKLFSASILDATLKIKLPFLAYHGVEPYKYMTKQTGWERLTKKYFPDFKPWNSL